MIWRQVVQTAVARVQDFSRLHKQRLKYELKEIEKQGSNTYWLNLIQDNKKFDKNPNYLILPWLLNMLVVKDADEYREPTHQEWLRLDPVSYRPDSDKLVLTTSNYSEIMNVLAEHGQLPNDIQLDGDKPDIDLDCLPEARNYIKEYASEKYGSSIQLKDDESQYGTVCSVGTWQTYKIRQALIDAYKISCGSDKSAKDKILALTTSLPDDVDELKEGGLAVCKGQVIDDKGESVECKNVHAELMCPKCGSSDTDVPTITKLLQEYDQLRSFAEANPHVIRRAIGLVGRIKTMGMHAGAIIIADRPLYGNLPLARGKSKKGQKDYWLSMWTEGRNTQLSKFGYIKWDILGLKNLKYISTCCDLIRQNRNISFGKGMEGWEDIDPIAGYAGWYKFIDPATGVESDKHRILLDDERVMLLAQNAATDAVFQFDTPLAKQILGTHKPNKFSDLMLLNAMGHPGPLESIPEAMANRDDESKSWAEELKSIHPELYETLKDTYGIICYQEQLARLWQSLGGFTGPEAQDARKAVAKKWKDQLLPIENKWIEGATKTIGRENAERYWLLQTAFARYAFNRSHAVSYCLVAHRCLWLKGYFPHEWWAAVMSDCHPEKLVRYMAVARSEGVAFAPLNVNKLTVAFTVTGDSVNPGLIGLKKVGLKAAEAFAGEGSYNNIDEFVAAKKKSKTVLERLIKLGSFDHLHPDDDGGYYTAKEIWKYYLLTYCSIDKDARKIKEAIQNQLILNAGWTEDDIIEERHRQMREYKAQYPKRFKVPNKVLAWQPKVEWNHQTVLPVIRLMHIKYGQRIDYTVSEKLKHEKEYLGYFITNPLMRYKHTLSYTFKNAIKCTERYKNPVVHAVVTKVEESETKVKADGTGGDKIVRLTMYDGDSERVVIIWKNQCEQFKDILKLAAMSLEPPLKEKDPKTGKIKIHWKHELGVGVKVSWKSGFSSFSLASTKDALWLLHQDD